MLLIVYNRKGDIVTEEQKITFDKEFKFSVGFLHNGEATIISGASNNYMVTREGELLRIYIQKPNEKHKQPLFFMRISAIK